MTEFEEKMLKAQRENNELLEEILAQLRIQTTQGEYAKPSLRETIQRMRAG